MVSHFSQRLKLVWIVAAFAVVVLTVITPGDTRAQADLPFEVSSHLFADPSLLGVGQTTQVVGTLIWPDGVDVLIKFSPHFRPEGEPCDAPYTGVSQSSLDSATISLVACSGGDAIVSLVAAIRGIVLEEKDVTITDPNEQTNSDRDALVALYNATDGPNWVINTNWLSDLPLREWYGVSTDANGRVIELNLYTHDGKDRSSYSGRITGNGLRGRIPRELGRLSNLDHLRLPRNQLSGEIPHELGGLSRLRVLDINDNRLSGDIPPELGDLSNLQTLNLDINRLSGNIPPELGGLAKLDSVWIKYNLLSGEIPPELGGLSNLESLDLRNNLLSGNIPPELGDLSSLRDLYLTYNQLGGEMPAELGDLSNLRILYLNANQLSGDIPPELGGLSNLETLDLGNNRLSGEIPPELGGLPSLRDLDLDYNQLSGNIPPELGGLSHLESLYLAGNRFSGCVPGGLRDVVTNDLNEVDLVHCDVLLSGLTLSPGLRVPQFDPYRTEYSASVGLAQVTVTLEPANDHGATFQYLDITTGNVLVDADDSAEGFQVEFGGGVSGVRINVISQDARVYSTYTVTDLGNRYDANGDSVISRDEVVQAIKDYFDDRITREEVIEVVKLYFQ